MDKRTFLKTGLLLGSGAMLSGRLFSATGTLSGDDEFKQEALDYAYDALEPYIDATTMELHYSKHHAGYTSKFNAAVKDEGLSGKGIKEIFQQVSQYSPAIRNNGGGYYNHSLYWKIMGPPNGKQASGPLFDAISSNFGSFDEFKSSFSKAGGGVFGSGWAWLINQDGKLKITQTANQDNPLMDICKDKGFPIIALDVWEHAYYLKYQNMRASYIEAFCNVLNWDYLNERYQKSLG